MMSHQTGRVCGDHVWADAESLPISEDRSRLVVPDGARGSPLGLDWRAVGRGAVIRRDAVRRILLRVKVVRKQDDPTLIRLRHVVRMEQRNASLRPEEAGRYQ